MGSNAKTGTSANPTTAWTGSLTKNTYFRNLRESGTATLVANWKYTATFYYYNGTSVTSTTASCTGGTSCTATIPSAVIGSKGKYNGSYKGLASTTNTMSGDPITFCVFCPKYRGRWHKCIVKDENLNVAEHWIPVLNKGVPYLLDKVNNRMEELGLAGTDWDYGI